MDLSDRVSQDVIKIFHNAKGSILNDVLKWTQTLHNTNNEILQVNEHVDTHTTVYMSKENRDEENPSIFGNQPVSEYSQQPFPPSKKNNSKAKDESFETEIEERSTDDEGLTLDRLKKDKDFNESRLENEGFTGNQR